MFFYWWPFWILSYLQWQPHKEMYRLLLEYFLCWVQDEISINLEDSIEGFIQFETIINGILGSFLFILMLCNGSTAVRNILILLSRGPSYIYVRIGRLQTSDSDVYPANTRRWPNVGLTLAHRLRRWPNISPTLGQRCLLGKDGLRTERVIVCLTLMSNHLPRCWPNIKNTEAEISPNIMFQKMS